MFKSDNFIWKYLSSCNVQFFETWTVSANLVKKHVVGDVSLQLQLGEALAIHYHRIEGRAAKIIFLRDVDFGIGNWDLYVNSFGITNFST